MIFNAGPLASKEGLNPTLAIFLELDIKINKNNKIKIKYDYFGVADLTDSKNSFDDMVAKFAAGDSVGKEIEPQEFEPCNNDLALRVGANSKAQLSYVAIRLDPKRIKGLSFAKQNGAFAPFAAAPGMSPKYLCNATPVGVDCLAAYFVADGAALASDEVIAEFSINIDIADNKGRIITLIVDPDIGYPGGNGTP